LICLVVLHLSILEGDERPFDVTPFEGANWCMPAKTGTPHLLLSRHLFPRPFGEPSHVRPAIAHSRLN
jgi:hypothetical protein